MKRNEKAAKKLKYRQAFDKDVIRLLKDGNARKIWAWRIRCCDCASVHDLAFRLTSDGELLACAIRNPRATAAARRKRK